jgi:hypothetical protein
MSYQGQAAWVGLFSVIRPGTAGQSNFPTNESLEGAKKFIPTEKSAFKPSCLSPGSVFLQIFYRAGRMLGKTLLAVRTASAPKIHSTCSSQMPVPKQKTFWRWKWFVLGFLLVFVGLMFLKIEYYDGHAVMATKRWHYYWLEMNYAWNSSGNLGPKTGSTKHAIYVAAEHILLAATSGVLLMGVVWFVRSKSAEVPLE